MITLTKNQLFNEIELLTNINDIAAESAEQDQTVRMCKLTLLYTLRKNKSKVVIYRIKVELLFLV